MNNESIPVDRRLAVERAVRAADAVDRSRFGSDAEYRHARLSAYQRALPDGPRPAIPVLPRGDDVAAELGPRPTPETERKRIAAQRAVERCRADGDRSQYASYFARELAKLTPPVTS